MAQDVRLSWAPRKARVDQRLPDGADAASRSSLQASAFLLPAGVSASGGRPEFLCEAETMISRGKCSVTRASKGGSALMAVWTPRAAITQYR